MFRIKSTVFIASKYHLARAVCLSEIALCACLQNFSDFFSSVSSQTEKICSAMEKFGGNARHKQYYDATNRKKSLLHASLPAYQPACHHMHIHAFTRFCIVVAIITITIITINSSFPLPSIFLVVSIAHTQHHIRTLTKWYTAHQMQTMLERPHIHTQTQRHAHTHSQNKQRKK